MIYQVPAKIKRGPVAGLENDVHRAEELPQRGKKSPAAKPG